MERVQGLSQHQLVAMQVDELKDLCGEMGIKYPGSKALAACALLEAVATAEVNGTSDVGLSSQGMAGAPLQGAAGRSFSSSTLVSTGASSGATPPLQVDVLVVQIAHLSKFISMQHQQFQALQEQVNGGVGMVRDKYPDQKFMLECDQHKYDVLVGLLHSLSWLMPSMSGQALVHTHNVLMQAAEARVAALVVTNMEGWTTVSFLDMGAPVPFLETRWASHIEVARKCAHQEEKASSLWSGWGQCCL
jgi:hypothetical protein